MQSMPVTNLGAFSSHSSTLSLFLFPYIPHTFHRFPQKVFAPGAADTTLPVSRSNSDALRRDRQVLIFQITTLYKSNLIEMFDVL